MASTTNNMGLAIWDSLPDLYDYVQFSNDWKKVDQHDHSTGHGVPIGASGLAPNAVGLGQLATSVTQLLYGSWIVAAGAGTFTPANGTLYDCSPNAIANLPAASGNSGYSVAFVPGTSVTSATKITINATAGAGIYGLGLNGASSMVLGIPMAQVGLVCDGTNWIIFEGRQDSGWIAPTVTTSPFLVTIATTTCGGRLQGDRVFLTGILNLTSGTTTGGSSSWGTIPTILRPARTTIVPMAYSAGVGSLTINTSGTLVPSPTTPGFIVLDSINYSTQF